MQQLLNEFLEWVDEHYDVQLLVPASWGEYENPRLPDAGMIAAFVAHKVQQAQALDKLTRMSEEMGLYDDR